MHTLLNDEQVLESVSAPAKLASDRTTVYQFSFVLPATLPSTMGAVDDGGSCQISYSATALLSHPDAEQALQV